ncbi:MAG: type IV pilus biogenesis/stability protein PilW [Burkholderiales bacterium]|jgi:type IV pilus assembly protein PilF
MNSTAKRIKFGLMGVALAVMLSACKTTTTSESKVADMAGKTNPTERAQIHTERAAEYFRLGNLAIALEAAQQAVSAQSGYSPAHNMLALIYMELREDAKAQASFEQAIRLSPTDSLALNNYGWFVCQRQDPQRSLALFERALRNPLYTTPQRALYNAGVCARRAGDLANAETQLRAALQRAPEFAAALYELADIYFTQRRIPEADSTYARFSKIVREPDANALLLGARLARATGDRNAEAGYISQLRRRFPDAPQTRDATQR